MGKRFDPTGLDPFCLALALCDHLHIDFATQRRTILAMFHVVDVDEFPTVYPKMAVYAALSDGRGRTSLEIRLIDADEDREAVWRATAEVDFVDPAQVQEIGFEIRDAVFVESGEYRLQLIASNVTIMERTIHVRQIEA